LSYKKHFYVFLALLIYSSEVCALHGRFESKENYRPISLNEAIQQGLKENHNQKIRESQNQILDLNWAGVWDKFWLPTLEFNLSTSPQRITRLRPGTSNSGTAPTAPTGAASLTLGEYVVFNWGKDYLQYLNEKQTIKRNKQSLIEGRRSLRHQIISTYFDLVVKKEVEALMRDQLRHASFIYRLNRQRVSAQKIPRQDYYQARAEFLRAQADYYDAKRELEQAHEQLAFLVDDPIGTHYVLGEKLEFRPIKSEFGGALELSSRNSPPILDAKLGEEVSIRKLEVAQRENMPLPKFSVDLGAYSQSFGRSQNTQGYETLPGSSNIELVVTLNATWTLYGEKGLLNHRTLAKAAIDRGIAERNLLLQKDYTSAQIRIIYNRILNYEKQIIALEARANNARKTYDLVMDNYTKSRARFTDFLHALRDLTESETALVQKKLAHLKDKVTLANTSGVEDFPGERFEDLALKTKNVEEVLDEEVETPIKESSKPEKSSVSAEPESKEQEATTDVPTPPDSSTEVTAPDSSDSSSSETTESVETPNNEIPDVPSDSSGSESTDSSSDTTSEDTGGDQ